MERPWELNWQRLPLEGLVNARELGGFPVAGGGQTRYHRFLRTDGLSTTTTADLAFLEGYGVTSVIDLRGADEVRDSPDRLPNGATYLHQPLFEFDISDRELAMRLVREHGGVPASFVYDKMFDNHEAVRTIFDFIASAPKGCVLFHCAVGKDRTGVLAALLMLLAGCDRGDVLASYVQSRVNLVRSPRFLQVWERECPDTERENYDSRPQTLGHWLDRLEREYGTCMAYLSACGVSYEVMEDVRARLLSA